MYDHQAVSSLLRLLSRCASRALSEKGSPEAFKLCADASYKLLHPTVRSVAAGLQSPAAPGSCQTFSSSYAGLTAFQHTTRSLTSGSQPASHSSFTNIPVVLQSTPVPLAAMTVKPNQMLQPVSAHPSVTQQGPGSTVAYPFPIDYYKDRDALVLSMSGEPQGLCTLPGTVFNVPVRLDILHRVVRWIRAMWRQGTHKAKSRAEVSGGGKKPWPQKGTGRGRAGSIRSPIFVGGGVAHPPKPRSHAHELPMSIQLMGYKCALSAKANEGRLVILDSLIPAPTIVDGRPVIKTKATSQQLEQVLSHVPRESVLLVDSGEDALDGGRALRRGAGNLPWATIMPWQQITVYHILKYKTLVMTRPAAMAMATKLQLPATLDPVVHKKFSWSKQQNEEYRRALEALISADKQQQQQEVLLQQ